MGRENSQRRRESNTRDDERQSCGAADPIFQALKTWHNTPAIPVKYVCPANVYAVLALRGSSFDTAFNCAHLQGHVVTDSAFPSVCLQSTMYALRILCTLTFVIRQHDIYQFLMCLSSLLTRRGWHQISISGFSLLLSVRVRSPVVSLSTRYMRSWMLEPLSTMRLSESSTVKSQPTEIQSFLVLNTDFHIFYV